MTTIDIDAIPQATDELIASLWRTLAERVDHEHPAKGGDLFCLNLTSFMGERMGPVLARLRAAESKVEELTAELAKARQQICLIVTCLECDEKYEYDGGVVHFSTLDEAQAMAEDDDWRRVGNQFVCGSCVYNRHPFKSEGPDILTCERCGLEAGDHEQDPVEAVAQ
ncbi:hypothetical protein ABZ749_01180 [Micromonospora sp. NPDC047753]|uniref:hypothetical protein n=1 Tax=Micromonospora sp. NPDC047753 TaxID=3154817 RepID=UPI0033C222C0